MDINDWIVPTLNPDFVYHYTIAPAIIEIYKSGSSSTRVAVQLGLTRTQFDKLRADNADFNNICEFGENIAQATLEDIAIAGVKGEIKNFNNTILQFLLKSQYPDTYNDKKGDKDEGDSLLEQLTAGSLKLVREPE